MSSLLEQVAERARELNVPLRAQLDLTWRCNQHCVHCYLGPDRQAPSGEMSSGELGGLLEEMAEAGVLFLSLSGGEIFLREDLFPVLERARRLRFDIRLKTNGTLIDEREAASLRKLGVAWVQVSLYSHRDEVHDAVTQTPGSRQRTLAGVRRLRAAGIRVAVADVLMRRNAPDRGGVKALAAELGAEFTVDPTVTPGLDGDRSALALGLAREELQRVFHDQTVVGDVASFTAGPAPVDQGTLDGIPCEAGHSSCYISPRGDLYPCVQFPLDCGNVRRQGFEQVWRHSPQLTRVRSIRGRDLSPCSRCAHLGTCSRCPGLAYLEGDLRGPSAADCEKAYLRTGIEASARSCWPTSW